MKSQEKRNPLLKDLTIELSKIKVHIQIDENTIAEIPLDLSQLEIVNVRQALAEFIVIDDRVLHRGNVNAIYEQDLNKRKIASTNFRFNEPSNNILGGQIQYGPLFISNYDFLLLSTEGPNEKERTITHLFSKDKEFSRSRLIQ